MRVHVYIYIFYYIMYEVRKVNVIFYIGDSCLRLSRLYSPPYRFLLPASSVISGIQLAITAYHRSVNNTVLEY